MPLRTAPRADQTEVDVGFVHGGPRSPRPVSRSSGMAVARPASQRGQHVAVQEARRRMLHPHVNGHRDSTLAASVTSTRTFEPRPSQQRSRSATAAIRRPAPHGRRRPYAAHTRRRTTPHERAAGTTDATRCGYANRCQRSDPLVAGQDGFVVRATEQRKHRKVRLAMTGVSSRVDQHHAVGCPHHVAAPEVAMQPRRTVLVVEIACAATLGN